jgi:chromosome segregation ATPase
MEFFKRFFAREPEEVQLSQIELKDWLDEISKNILTEENSEIKRIFSEIFTAKQELRDTLNELEKQELVNPNTPEREKHIMQGNRQQYIRALINFLDETKLPELDYGEIDEFSKEFHSRLQTLNETTSKGYFVLRHFFDKEMSKVASLLKKLEDNVVRLSSLLKKDRISQFRALTHKIRELNQSSIKSSTLDEQTKELAKEIEATKTRKASIEKQKAGLKESTEYLKYLKAEKEKKEIDKEIEDVKSRLINIIKPMDKALKKLMHESTKKQIISAYLEDTPGAFERDTQYRILAIIQTLKKTIEEGRIEVKNKQKFINSINSVDKEKLEAIRKELDELKSRKETARAILERSSTLMDLKELDYQLEHLDNKLRKSTEELSEKKSVFSSLQFEQKARKLEKSLSEFSGKKIIIQEDSSIKERPESGLI